jgi:5'-nucleotidase
VKVARQGFRIYTDKVAARLDNRGKKYFWLGGKYAGFKQIQGSDCEVLDQGYISITPFRIDLTQYDYMETLANWIPSPKAKAKNKK